MTTETSKGFPMKVVLFDKSSSFGRTPPPAMTTSVSGQRERHAMRAPSLKARPKRSNVGRASTASPSR